MFRKFMVLLKGWSNYFNAVIGNTDDLNILRNKAKLLENTKKMQQLLSYQIIYVIFGEH